MEFVFYHPFSRATFYLNEAVAIRSLLLTGMKGAIYSELGTGIDDYLNPAKNSELYRIGLVSKYFPDDVSADHQEHWESFMKGMRTLRAQKHLPKEGIIHKQKCEKNLDEKMKAVDLMLVEMIRAFQATEVVGFFKDNTLAIVRPPFHFNDMKAEAMLVQHITQTLIGNDKILVMPSEFYQDKDELDVPLNKEKFNEERSEIDRSISTAFTELYTIPNLNGLSYNQMKAAIAEFSEYLQPVLDAFLKFKQTITDEKIEISEGGRFDSLSDELFDPILETLQEQINNSIYYLHILNKKETYPETTVCAGSMSFKGLIYMYYHMKFYSYDAALSIVNAVSKHRDVEEICVFLFNKTTYENMEHLSAESKTKVLEAKAKDDQEIETVKDDDE